MEARAGDQPSAVEHLGSQSTRLGFEGLARISGSSDVQRPMLSLLWGREPRERLQHIVVPQHGYALGRH